MPGAPRAAVTFLLPGAVYQGQTLINGQAYNQYGLGSTTVMVEDAVVTVVI